MQKLVPAKSLAENLPSSVDLLLTCASFESRCLSVFRQLRGISIKKRAVCYYAEADDIAIAHRDEMLVDVGTTGQPLKLSIVDPVRTADTLVELLRLYASNRSRYSVVIDITTFTRETLLIILRIVATFDLSASVTFLYTPSSEMSKHWLSQGVVSFRSVLGYPGLFDPQKKVCLILLQGFELERAKATILNYEPDLVIIGVGDRNDSISKSFYERNRKFVQDLQQWYGIAASLFEHSLTDPVKAKEQIGLQIEGVTTHNVVLAPLNNKISTLGAGLAAIDKSSVQICYAQVAQYNHLEYSTPDDKVYLLSLT